MCVAASVVWDHIVATSSRQIHFRVASVARHVAIATCENVKSALLLCAAIMHASSYRHNATKRFCSTRMGEGLYCAASIISSQVISTALFSMKNFSIAFLLFLAVTSASAFAPGIHTTCRHHHQSLRSTTSSQEQLTVPLADAPTEDSPLMQRSRVSGQEPNAFEVRPANMNAPYSERTLSNTDSQVVSGTVRRGYKLLPETNAPYSERTLSNTDSQVVSDTVRRGRKLLPETNSPYSERTLSNSDSQVVSGTVRRGRKLLPKTNSPYSERTLSNTDSQVVSGTVRRAAGTRTLPDTNSPYSEKTLSNSDSQTISGCIRRGRGRARG